MIFRVYKVVEDWKAIPLRDFLEVDQALNYIHTGMSLSNKNKFVYLEVEGDQLTYPKVLPDSPGQDDQTGP